MDFQVPNGVFFRSLIYHLNLKLKPEIEECNIEQIVEFDV